VSAADLERDQQGGIADFGRGCDLVLGYDIPTSGMFDLLNAGVPALQALCRPLAPNEWRIVDPTVVPQLPVAAMLERLDGFASDSLALWRFRRDQTGLALQAGSAALPLRAWL
jgi:hypothetical protein